MGTFRLSKVALLGAVFIFACIGCRGELATTSDGNPEGSVVEEAPPKFEGEIPEAEQCVGAAVEPGPTLGRRLTNWEYAFTLQDTFGVDVRDRVGDRFDDDLRTEGFSNTSTTLIVNLDRVQAYEELAAAVVGQIDDFPGLVDEHTSCTNFEESCERDFVRSIGKKLFRRPLDEEEVVLYDPIFDIVETEGDTFEVAAQLVVQGMLQAPQFLYRLEGQSKEQRELDGFEVASRLSYLTWSSAPDDELIRAAEAGELTTEAGIEAQVRRMLEDPRSLRSSERFVRDWLNLDRLDNFQRDDSLYPEYSQELGREMQAETLRVAEQVLREEGRPLTDLLTTRTTHASRDLAEFYGFDQPQDGVAEYDLTDHPERVGILTHAGVLATAGGGNEPSLVQRGLFVLHEVMCRSVDAPSVDVDTEFKPAEPGKTQRFYSELRLQTSQCAGCHAQFDPLGYGFETYDGVGQPITNDFAGNELTNEGYFIDHGDGTQQDYADTAEYMNKLAASTAVQDCLVQKPVQFALGRALVESDACMLSDVKDRYLSGETTYEELVVAIATHPNFRHVAPAGGAQ